MKSLGLALGIWAGYAQAETVGAQPVERDNNLRAALFNQPQLRNKHWADFYRGQEGGGYWFKTEAGWFGGLGLSEHGQALYEAVKTTSKHGLNPADYAWQKVQALQASGPADVAAQAAAEILFMQSYLTLYRHLAQGRYPELAEAAAWYIRQDDFSEADALRRLQRLGPTAALASIEPALQEYGSLLKAREHMLLIVEQGGWPQFTGQGLLKPGMQHPGLPDLRRRLYIGGDLEQPEPQGEAAAIPELYDEVTASAVRRFQRRYGLQEDGIVGPNARAMLNIPAEQRLAQIDVNLERLRWLPYKLADDRIMVNIAAYQLQAYREGKQELEMRVVVGDAQNQTPAFTDSLEYIEINPYWSIPNSIVVNELAPKQLENSGYLESRNMRVYEDWDEDADTMDYDDVDWEEYTDPEAIFPYVIKQDPGPWNALGRIKFMFPNEYSIYLHDTPETGLFYRADRGFSHGCIRVEKPMAVAEFILRNTEDWDMEEVQETLEDRDKTRVDLAPRDRLQVYIYYLTSWADESGVLYFRPDLYEHDVALLNKFGPANTRMMSAQ